MLAAGPAAALAQAGSAARATGCPMPDDVEHPAAPPQRKRPDSVGFAVVGLGGYALNQMMPQFTQAERAHVAAAVSGNPNKLRRVGDAYGVPTDARYSYEMFASIAADKRIDAVYIVLPSGLHAEWAVRAFGRQARLVREADGALQR